jgi:hypothetical protein
LVWAPTPFTSQYHQANYTARKPGYPGIELTSAPAALSP